MYYEDDYSEDDYSETFPSKVNSKGELRIGCQRFDAETTKKILKAVKEAKKAA
jgi:hypothetical protein